MTTAYRSLIVFVSAVAVGGLMMAPVRTRSFSDRKANGRSDSEPPKAVQGGVTFKVALPYAKVFESVVDALKRQHRGIDVADRQAGRIFSQLAVTGGWRQRGTRIQVFLFKDSEMATTIKIQVTSALRRYQAVEAEPWGSPSLDMMQTAKESALLRMRI
jgi:hypothetical protein